MYTNADSAPSRNQPTSAPIGSVPSETEILNLQIDNWSRVVIESFREGLIDYADVKALLNAEPEHPAA
jgi:hypothetical protein